MVNDQMSVEFKSSSFFLISTKLWTVYTDKIADLARFTYRGLHGEYMGSIACTV